MIRGYTDALRMVKEVPSPYLKICFDARLEHGLDDDGIRKAANEIGSLQTLWNFGSEYAPGTKGIQPKRDEKCMGEMLGLFDIGYRGFAGYELCPSSARDRRGDRGA